MAYSYNILISLFRVLLAFQAFQAIQSGNSDVENYDFSEDQSLLKQMESKSYSNNIDSCSKKICFCADKPIKQEVNLFPRTPICGTVLSNRIVGGTNTTIDEYPWAVRIKYNNIGKFKFLCGGSLISSSWVLTAAHCATGYAMRGAKIVGVRLGEWNTKTNPDCEYDTRGRGNCAPSHVDVDVDRIVPHEDFDKTRRYAHDIALLHLAKVVDFTNFVRPICLPIEKTFQHDKLLEKIVEVTGWGRTNRDNIESVVKQKATLTVYPLNVCQWSYWMWGLVLDEMQMCAGSQIGIDTCRGDSGGPLMLETKNDEQVAAYYVVGIVSFGSNCRETNQPAVYTHVGSYMNWITKKIREYH